MAEAEEVRVAIKVNLSLVLGGILVVFVHLIHVLLLKPKALRAKLRSQGIRGPSPSLLHGNLPEIQQILQNKRSVAGSTGHTISHALPSMLFPHIEQWRQEYGPIFMYSAGNLEMLCITDPEKAKEISTYTCLNLGKPSSLSKVYGPLLGQGILSSNGPYWAHQRKIIAPQLYLNKVKEMVNLMVDSSLAVLQAWDQKIENSGEAEINVDNDLRGLSADIISRACFGSSYSEGEIIFSRLRSLQQLMSKGNPGIPVFSRVTKKYKTEIQRLDKEIRSMILKVIKVHSEATCEKNLLQLILEAAKNHEEHGDLPVDISPDTFIVDNCKNIFFAGHETTAISASRCLMLLAAYPQWQVRARAEVLQICGSGLPNEDMLRRMKVLTMVINETLRLYPPVAFLVREALKDVNFKDIQIPQGTNIQVPIPVLHHHPDLWGADASQFNPERFIHGVTNACRVPQAYMPFGVGNRICVGQHFAMLELKVILSIILSRFSFSLSPAYQHCPAFTLVIEPGNGVNLCFKRL